MTSIAFRPAITEPDLKFVISSWLDASKFSHSSGLIAMEDWYAIQWAQYAKAISRLDMRTIVAYEKTDPDYLYGFIVADPTEQRVPQHDGSVRWFPALVLFVFTKQTCRRRGIARDLFREVGIDPTSAFLYGCNTPQASRLEAKVPRAKFNPIVARFPKERRA